MNELTESYVLVKIDIQSQIFNLILRAWPAQDSNIFNIIFQTNN